MGPYLVPAYDGQNEVGYNGRGGLEWPLGWASYGRTCSALVREVLQYHARRHKIKKCRRWPGRVRLVATTTTHFLYLDVSYRTHSRLEQRMASENDIHKDPSACPLSGELDAE